MFKTIVIVISLSFLAFTNQVESNYNTNKGHTAVVTCNSSVGTGGSCVSKVGSVCSYYSEWFIDKEWLAEEEHPDQ